MTEARRKRILGACYSFLVPVAKFLLRSGISFREFEELGRLAFINVASGDFGVRGRSTNTSRIAIMTGIPRKEVTRIRGVEERYSDDPRVELSLLGHITHVWGTDPDYCDLHGLPRALPLEGDGVSFEDLVGRCATDVPVVALRTELMRCRAIEIGEDGYARLSRRYIVSDDFDEKLIAGITMSLRSLAETIAFNSNPDRTGAGHIERFVRSEPLSSFARSELRIRIREKIGLYTEEFDDMFASHESMRGDDRRTIGVGLYYWEDEE